MILETTIRQKIKEHSDEHDGRWNNYHEGYTEALESLLLDDEEIPRKLDNSFYFKIVVTDSDDKDVHTLLTGKTKTEVVSKLIQKLYGFLDADLLHICADLLQDSDWSAQLQSIDFYYWYTERILAGHSYSFRHSFGSIEL